MLETSSRNHADGTSISIPCDVLGFVATNVMRDALGLVDSIRFDKLNAKLVSHYGWSQEEVDCLCALYREWLALHIC
ncbi:hypothetical protein NHP190002_06940 [Helicobacter ailurogastricus]|nr:hypothetical protein [Helicobacter ailurogastricus]GMB90013.1 hypothetical protein NHP190002_06940 [Helicobacter ailurogastricus]